MAASSRFCSTMVSKYKVLFPGQGSQYVGMTKSLPSRLPLPLENLFNTANDILGYNIRDICIHGPVDTLNATVYCQPAVVVASLAAYQYSRAQIDCVAAMAGFSVGELTALIASNSISLEQGLQLVKIRALAMQDSCTETPSGMITIIGLNKDALNQCLSDSSTIANHLSSNTYTVSGTLEALEQIKTKAIANDASSVKTIPVSGGFHSSFMSSAVPKLKKAVDSVDVKMPNVPVYSNVTGREYTSVSEIKELLPRQLISPVLWKEIVKNMIEKYGEENFAEIGPSKQLKSILRKTNKTSFKSCVNIEV